MLTFPAYSVKEIVTYKKPTPSDSGRMRIMSIVKRTDAAGVKARFYTGKDTQSGVLHYDIPEEQVSMLMGACGEAASAAYLG